MPNQTATTTCNLCEAGCGIVVETRGRDVVTIRGDKDDPLSQGYICPKAAALADLYTDPDRLRTPRRRTSSGWEEISWDEAFDEVAARICKVRDRHGRDALAVYQGNPTIHSLGAMTFGQVFMRSLATRNAYSATSADQLPHMLASFLMFGHQLLLPVPDIDRTHLMIILGANPLASNGSMMCAPNMKKRLADLRARGGRVVVIDPRRTETAEVADAHLFIRPGTDALLLLAMIDTLFAEQLVALGRLAPHVDGLDAVRQAAARFSAGDVSGVVGIDAEVIRSLARSLAAAPSATLYGRLGTCTQEFGGLNGWLLNVVNILTGNLDRPGGVMFTTPAVDIVKIAGKLGQTGSFAEYTSGSRGLPEFGGELPVSMFADQMIEPGPSQIRALLVHAGNPVLSTPNGAKLDAALAGLDFMVAIDPYINETTHHAHIILPPTVLLERDHCDLALDLLSVRNRAKFSPAVFSVGPEQRHDWQIFLELMTRIDGHKKNIFRRGVASAASRLAARLGPRAIMDIGLRTGPHGLSVSRLLKKPHGLDLGPLESRLPELLHTEGRCIHLAPDEYLVDLDRLAARAETLAGSGLRLIGRRDLRSNNSWMHNSRQLVKGKPRCVLRITAVDAAERGLHDGDRVTLRSRTGAVEVAIEISDEMMPGIVSLPHGWGHDRKGVQLAVAREFAGVSVNDVTDELFVDTFSGMACFNGVPVEVEGKRADVAEVRRG